MTRGIADLDAPVERTGRPARRQRRGQVLLITLVALTLLVGLIFYVYNLGDMVNRRLSLQTAADSAAVSGGGWMARSMNVIAMNNCGEARMLALVPVLDSVPLAVEWALRDAEASERALVDANHRLKLQLIQLSPSEGRILSNAMADWQARVSRKQHESLEPMNLALNIGNFDMRTATFWSSPFGERGLLWQAALAMDEFSRATFNSAGTLAQADAIRFAKIGGASGALLVPILPRLPAVRTRFEDLRSVLACSEFVRNQWAAVYEDPNGGAIPDFAFPHRLGPWARLFRNPWPPSRLPGTWKDLGQGWRFSVELPRNVLCIGYRTFGPYKWALRCLREDTYELFGFAGHLRRLADVKLGYMFDPPLPDGELARVHEPNWVTDYPTAMQIVATEPNLIKCTILFEAYMSSLVPEEDPTWGNPETTRVFEVMQSPPFPGWEPPWRYGGRQIANYIWRRTFRPVPLLMPDGSPDPVGRRVYETRWCMWGAIDIGPNVPVRNPCNFLPTDDLPAPWLLDTSQGDYDPGNLSPDQGVRRTLFSLLGVARDAKGAAFWPNRFAKANPVAMTAAAQVKLFNHSSWDLWTQDWQAQLTPVTLWSDWAERINHGRANAGATNGMVTEEDLADVYDYFHRLKPVADKFVQH